MTYLEIINKVLKRLREDQVSTVDYSVYSLLIGEFVNDAKKEVENAYNWNALLVSENITANGTDSTNSFTNITSQDARLAYDECGYPMVFDVTDGYECQLNERAYFSVTRESILNVRGLSDMDKPSDFSVYWDGSAWNYLFYGIPAQGREYRFYFYAPQDELIINADTVQVPWRPIVNLAVLYALDERGEEIGEPGSKAWMRYENSLSDAISIANSGADSFKTNLTVS